MSKLDDVLEGTANEDEAGVDPADFDRTGTYEAAAKLAEGEAEEVAETRKYPTAEEILTAEANGEISSDEAIRLLDELDEAEAEDTANEPPEQSEVEDAGPVAGPRDHVRIVKTGEHAVVAHATGNGGVALAGEEKPRRTLARHEYTLA